MTINTDDLRKMAGNHFCNSCGSWHSDIYKNAADEIDQLRKELEEAKSMNPNEYEAKEIHRLMAERNGMISRLRSRWQHIEIARHGARIDPGAPTCLRCSIEIEIGAEFGRWAPAENEATIADLRKQVEEITAMNERQQETIKFYADQVDAKQVNIHKLCKQVEDLKEELRREREEGPWTAVCAFEAGQQAPAIPHCPHDESDEINFSCKSCIAKYSKLFLDQIEKLQAKIRAADKLVPILNRALNSVHARYGDLINREQDVAAAEVMKFIEVAERAVAVYAKESAE